MPDFTWLLQIEYVIITMHGISAVFQIHADSGNEFVCMCCVCFLWYCIVYTFWYYMSTYIIEKYNIFWYYINTFTRWCTNVIIKSKWNTWRKKRELHIGLVNKQVFLKTIFWKYAMEKHQLYDLIPLKKYVPHSIVQSVTYSLLIIRKWNVCLLMLKSK